MLPPSELPAAILHVAGHLVAGPNIESALLGRCSSGGRGAADIRVGG
jgi:hypothetical protein